MERYAEKTLPKLMLKKQLQKLAYRGLKRIGIAVKILLMFLKLVDILKCIFNMFRE